MKVTILWLPYMVFGTEGWNRPILKKRHPQHGKICLVETLFCL